MSADQAAYPTDAYEPTENMLTALRQRVLVEADDDDLRDAVRAMLAALDGFVLVPVKPTLAMTLAFHDACPHRPTGWTAEEAWAAMIDAAAKADCSSARCPSCKGEKWVDDENWSPPYIDIPCERVPHAGRIPCARCNFSGWNEPDGAIFAQDRRG